MTQIILTTEQMQVLLNSINIDVEVCDPHGNVLGRVRPEASSEFIAEMKRRSASPGRRYTFQQCQNHLRALEEAWQRERGFDEARMKEILEEIRTQEDK